MNENEVGNIPNCSKNELMPRLHLLRSSYDLFVFDFLYDFFGIGGGYKLRRLCLHCLRSPCNFFRRQTRTKPYRDLADIVQQPQGYRTIIVSSSQIARCPYEDLAGVDTPTLQLSFNFVHEFKRPSMFIFWYILELCFKVMWSQIVLWRG